MEPFTLILAAVLAQSNAATPPPPAPTPPVRVDADGDGSVSRAEYMARFDRLDTNRDGTLTRDERRAGMAWKGGRRGAMAGRGAGAGKRAPAADTSRADFLARAGKRFDRLDANHDGTVEVAEWQNARRFRRDMPPTMPAR